MQTTAQGFCYFNVNRLNRSTIIFSWVIWVAKTWVCLSVASQGWFAQRGALLCLSQGLAKHSPVLPRSLRQLSGQVGAQSLSIRTVPRSLGSHTGRCIFTLHSSSLWVQSRCPVSSVTTLARAVPERVTPVFYGLPQATHWNEGSIPPHWNQGCVVLLLWLRFFLEKVLFTGKKRLSKNEIVGKSCC